MNTSTRSPHRQARIWLGLVALLAGLGTAHAQLNLNIPNAGSDGPLVINAETVSHDNISVAGTNVVIDLSMAVTGVWDADNSGNIGKGTYDPEKWAVVFKYSSVSIADGMHVSFKNHSSRAPVVWLVDSNLTIGEECTLNLSGGWTARLDAPLLLNPTEPGPGGFRGPAVGSSGEGWGFGPGNSSWVQGNYRSDYGNPAIIPLVGGSGGRLTGNADWGGSCGGGGAILIVVGQTMTLDGKILSRAGSFSPEFISRAAGGAVRIVADKILGGQSASFPGGVVDVEREGRIRIEATEVSEFLKLSPSAAAVPLVSGATPVIWPPTTTPSVRVFSVDASVAPVDPLANVTTSSDTIIQENGPVDIMMESRNLPIEGVVRLRVGPKYAGAVWHTATYVSGDINQALWRVTTTLPPGFTVLQARATAP